MCKFPVPRTTFESALDKHIATIVCKIACHRQSDPSPPLHIAQPVGCVLAVFAPAIKQDIKCEIRIAVRHSRLQSFLQEGELNFLFIFHKLSPSCLLLYSYLPLTCPLRVCCFYFPGHFLPDDTFRAFVSSPHSFSDL